MAEESDTFNNKASRNDWVPEFLESIVQLTKENVLVWCDTVNKFGMDAETHQRWKNIFTEAVADLYKDLKDEINDHQTRLFDEIENLLQQSSSLCKELHIRIPEYGSQQLTLCEEKRILRERVQEYETLLADKKEEIEKLNRIEVQLCRTLDRPMKTINTSPLPTPDIIDEFKNYLEALDFDKMERTAQSANFRELILNLAEELNYKPTLDFEKKVLKGENLESLLTDINIRRLKDFYKSLENQVNDTKEEILALREKVQQLWERLEEDPKYSGEFMQKHTGNTLDTLQALKQEVNRCEALRKANIEGFVNASRTKLLELWNKCHFTDEQREFEFFHTDLYTEDLLALHDIEINRNEQYYKENEKIFSLLEERRRLWEKMLVLEEQATQPDRYKNRGGQLLREEKERNAISKRIPHIEQQLMKLAESYQALHNKPFLSWGETIETIIFHDRDKHDEEKRLKLSARKIQRDKTITPGKSTLGLTPCSSVQNLACLTPFKGTVKRKMATPLHSAKRNRTLKENNDNAPRTAPPKITINSKTVSRSRYSIERGKRIAKCRAILRRSAQRRLSKEKDLSSVYPPEYDAFEKDIENKEDCRSTFFQASDSENAPLAVPLPVTPRWPKGTPNRTKSPSNTAKLLTPAPALKLLF